MSSSIVKIHTKVPPTVNVLKSLILGKVFFTVKLVLLKKTKYIGTFIKYTFLLYFTFLSMTSIYKFQTISNVTLNSN
jgi:hypothetical protein